MSLSKKRYNIIGLCYKAILFGGVVMPLVAAKCTNCGCVLEVDSTKDAAICPSCNNPYVVEKAINNYQSSYTLSAASANSSGVYADDLFRDAQTLIDLGGYVAASEKYRQMMEAFPADPRGWMGVVRLAIEHHTPLSGGKTHLNPLKVTLKLSDNEFLNWLYQNFDKDEAVVRAGVDYISELGFEAADHMFLEYMNQHFEKKCKRIRSGESNIVQEFSNSLFDIKWDSENEQLKFYCDFIRPVTALLEEAKENAAYFNSWIKKIGLRPYHNVARETIKELWGTDSGDLYSLIRINGGLIGRTLYCMDDEHPTCVSFYSLSKVITREEIDKLFQEITRRCNLLGVCVCGGKKGFFSNRCSNCGRPM